MPEKNYFNRRKALKVAALSVLSLPLLGKNSIAAESGPATKKNSRAAQLKLGLASYSLSKLSVDDVIATMKQLELSAVSLYKTHCDWSSATPDECKAVVQKFSDAGIAVTSTGMIEVTTDEAAVRKSLENVRAAGLKTFCGWVQDISSLPLLEKLVKEYDLKAAIHNHGPTQLLATGMDVWKAVQPFDKRVGLCLDVGHGFRAGENPADTIHKCHERIYEVHLRDTGVTGGTMKDAQPVIIGHGLVDFRAIISTLLEVQYPFQAEFEYEKKEDNRVPGLAESAGYIRGLLAA